MLEIQSKEFKRTQNTKITQKIKICGSPEKTLTL